MAIGIYLATCVVTGWFGRRRLLGFWGNGILAFFVSPLVVGLVLLAGYVRPRAPLPPARPVTR